MPVRGPIPSVVIAAAWVVFAGTCYVVSGALTRHLAESYTTFELVFLRCVIAILFLSPMLLRGGVGSLRTVQLKLHVGRSLLTYAGLLCWFYGVSAIPLADYYALQFTMPLFTIAGAVLFLGEKAGSRTWIVVAVGFCGVLIILRPGFAEVSLGAVAALGAALSYAGVNNCVKVLSRRESTTVIVVYANLLVLTLSFVPALYGWRTPTLGDLPLIAGIGIASTTGQIALTNAISMADARVVQPFEFMRVPVAAAVGYVVFAEFPDPWTWLGAVVIFASGYYVIAYETRRSGPGAAPP